MTINQMPSTGSRLTLRLIGTPAIQNGDASHNLALVDAVLLAVLALEGPTARSELLKLLWPDGQPKLAGTNLRQRLHRLRRIHGDVVQGDRILTLASDVEVDVQSLRSALATDAEAGRGRLLAGIEAEDNEALEARLLTWRGRFERERCGYLTDQAEALGKSGRLAEAIRYAERLVEESPLAEHGYRRLMRLHHLRGDPAAAHAVYGQCCQVLQDELGATPALETEALVAQLGEAEARDAPASPLPICLLRPPRWVGRKAVHRALEQAINAGGPVVIWGEAGLGKSRLLDEVLVSRPQWPRVAALPGDASLPFALMATLVAQLTRRYGGNEPAWVRVELARLVPDMGPAGDDPFDRLRLRQALLCAMGVWSDAGLQGVAVDDLQFADSASLELLAPLASRATQSWIFASRPFAGAPAWLTDEVKAVALEPLTLPEVAELLASLALDGLNLSASPEALLQESGGNPLAILQILTSRWEERSSSSPSDSESSAETSVLRVVQVRLERLSPEARTLARVAAAAGTEFTVELAAQVLGVHHVSLADAVQELRNARMLVDHRFVHETLRDAVYRGTPPEVARLLHRDLGRLLASSGVVVRPGTIAAHWEAAEHWAHAAAAWEQAASEARQRSGVVEELRAVEAALRCVYKFEVQDGSTTESQQRAFELEVRAVRLALATLALDAAYERVLDLNRGERPPLQGAQAKELLAHVLLERREFAEALTAAESAARLARGDGDARLGLLALQRQAMALMQLNRVDDAVSILQTAGSLDSLSSDERLQWRTDQALVYDYADERRESILALDAVIAESEREGRLLIQAEAWSTRGLALMYVGRLAESHSSLERSMDCGRRAGLDEQALLVDEMSAIGHLRDLGRFDLYLPRAEELPGALRAAGQPFWAANADHDLAVAWAWLGRGDLAMRALATPSEGLPAPMRAARLFTRARLARDFGVLAAAPAPGEPGRLVREAIALLAATAAKGRSYVRLRIELEATRDLPPAEAAEQAGAIEAQATLRQNLMLATSAAMMKVRYLGEAENFVKAAEEAWTLYENVNVHGPQAGIYAPDLWWAASQALARVDLERALIPLRDALGWLNATAQRVPALYRSSFLQRNPVNYAVLQATRQQAEKLEALSNGIRSLDALSKRKLM